MQDEIFQRKWDIIIDKTGYTYFKEIIKYLIKIKNIEVRHQTFILCSFSFLVAFYT